VIVGRRDLDNVDPGYRKLHRDPADSVEKLPARQAAGLGRSGSRGQPRVHDVHVD
jgi:hypothetical protein